MRIEQTFVCFNEDDLFIGSFHVHSSSILQMGYSIRFTSLFQFIFSTFCIFKWDLILSTDFGTVVRSSFIAAASVPVDFYRDVHTAGAVFFFPFFLSLSLSEFFFINYDIVIVL